jgi:Ni/Co efflux regulator RcnB
MAMRKLMLVLLLAGIAAPAVAADRDGNNRSTFRGPRAERDESSDDSPRREKPAPQPQRNAEPHNDGPRPDRSGPVVRDGGGAPETPRVAPVDHRAAGDSVRNWRQGGDTAFEQRAKKVERPTLPDRPETERRNHDAPANDTVRNWRGRDRGQTGGSGSIEDRNVRVAPGVTEGGLVQSRRPMPRILRPADGRVSRTPEWGTQPPSPRSAGTARAHSDHRWNGNWRHDHRYDWRNYRHRHHDHFRFAFYSDPFGWDYLRYGVGWRLWPSYYGSSFWLNDPWSYRLPPAYGPYRWIRYYNDALLVNIYTGQVVDVEYDFFW